MSFMVWCQFKNDIKCLINVNLKMTLKAFNAVLTDVLYGVIKDL